MQLINETMTMSSNKNNSDETNDPMEKIIPDTDSMFWYKNRLKTYTNWPFTDSKTKCNPSAMAAAGFFAIGDANEPDLVECFICNKQLDGWDSTDDPWAEHKKHTKACAFLDIGKTDELSMTLEEIYILFKQFGVSSIKRVMNSTVNDAKEKQIKLVNDIKKNFKFMKNKRK